MIIKFCDKTDEYIRFTVDLVAVILSVLTFVSLIGWWHGVDNVLFPGLGIIAAMPAIIVLLLILNIIFVIAAAVVKPKKESTGETRNEQNFEYPDDIFGGCGNGVLDLSVAENPEKWGQTSADRHLKVCINYDDLESIYDVIAPSRVSYESYREGEDYRKFEERNKKIFEENNKKIFEQAVSEFPMLGRINDIYADYVFNSEEVKMLREECLSAQKGKINAAADLTLRKLIYACDEALKENFYLMFSGD